MCCVFQLLRVLVIIILNKEIKHELSNSPIYTTTNVRPTTG